MKRCPVEAGGCGCLVDMLFDSGLCQKCDAAVKRGTAAVGGLKENRSARSKAEGAEEAELIPCGKYVKGPERGICKTCGLARAGHLAKKSGAPRKKRGPGARAAAGPDDPFMKIEQLRSEYTDEYDKAVALSNAWLAKLEVLDDVEKAIKAAK